MHLQTKRIPFNDLQLRITDSLLTRERNEVGRSRQNIIVCASLIDKITNLAGIARTCEIFSAKELILSDLAVVSTDAFQGVAVSSSCWLPIREVRYESLKAYIRELRLKGHQIVGVEQTGSSVQLQSAMLSDR
jgi:tRNA G18 (ribose-2'-O)-methylase SpoU